MTKLGKGFEEILEASTSHFVNVGDEPTNINVASNINVGHIKAEDIVKPNLHPVRAEDHVNFNCDPFKDNKPNNEKMDASKVKVEKLTDVEGSWSVGSYGTMSFDKKVQEADATFNHYHAVRETEEFNAVVTDLIEDLQVESIDAEASPNVLDSMLYNVLALATMLTTGKVDNLDAPFTPIKWQEGTVTDNGQNGMQVPEVLEVVHGKLTGYQDSFPCRENAISLTKIEEAIMWQNKRTNDRIKRGVEGMHIK